MPSFSYNGPSMHRLPLTPPEDLPSYSSATMPSISYQQGAYAQPMSMRHQDERSYDWNDRHHQAPAAHAPLPPMMYGPPPSTGCHYYSAFPPNPHAENYYRPMAGPMLPPIHGYDQGSKSAIERPQATSQHQHNESRPKQQKEEKPVGGVSAKLDYELEDMTDFVADTSLAIITPNRPAFPGFRKWVNQVLSATRLPSATILLAFVYLDEHMRKMQAQRMVQASEAELHRILTTSLILASKFLDDNTFINRSWAEVSGISVTTLNYQERLWLEEIGFHLHRHREDPHGFDKFQDRWNRFLADQEASRQSRARPAAINTTFVPTGPIHHGVYSPASYGQPSPADRYGKTAYPTPAYSRYDPYMSSRHHVDTSPPSAPHTGPTTPEYYGAQGLWATLNDGYRGNRAPTGYNNSQAGVAAGYAQAPHGSNNYTAPPLYAKTHGAECFCMNCARNWIYAPHFGMQQPIMA